MKGFSKEQFKNLIKQGITFGLGGGLATAVHFSVVVFSVEVLNIYPLIANVFGYLSAVMVSYIFHLKLTFKMGKGSRDMFFKFFILSAGGFLLNQFLFYILFEIWRVDYKLSLAFAMMFVAGITFAASKFLIFKNKRI